ncbi:MAG: glycosyltransferase [Weeksellaceae bacterium]
MQPFVTISIPLFNCEEFLVKCLDSVRNQTYPAIEVSLINDQTPDNSVAIAEEYIQKYNLKNWRILHLDKNSGLSVVRNKGIDTANGKYLFFLDSDDTISADCIEKLVEVADRTNADMSISQIECEKSNTGEKLFCLGQLKDIETIEGNQEVLKAFSKGRIPSSAVNKLFNVDYLRENKLYFVPGLFAQDELWTFHLILKMNKVAFHQGITYTYYLHDKSVIHTRGKRHFDNWFTIGQYIDIDLKKETDTERRDMILNYLVKYKNTTLLMNWRAQKNEELWKESYRNYKTLSSLSFRDYFSNSFSSEVKKIDFLNRLPTSIGFWVFKKRWGT